MIERLSIASSSIGAPSSNFLIKPSKIVKGGGNKENNRMSLGPHIFVEKVYRPSPDKTKRGKESLILKKDQVEYQVDFGHKSSTM